MICIQTLICVWGIVYILKVLVNMIVFVKMSASRGFKPLFYIFLLG